MWRVFLADRILISVFCRKYLILMFYSLLILLLSFPSPLRPTYLLSFFRSFIYSFPRSLILPFFHYFSWFIIHSFLYFFIRSFFQGGFDYKKGIVSAIISIIEENPDAKETGLSHLCEFIEDCEHTSLATKILHLLGCEGPRTPNPSKFIRYIYNRVILENAEVRAAAVSALAKFGAHCDSLLPSILVLLSR